MNYKETDDFKKDFKKLFKKYKSLKDDLDVFKRILNTFPKGSSRHSVAISVKNGCTIIKSRLFCRYLKGSSLRIIYAYFEEGERFEFIGIEFLELYYKGDKEREDKKRIDKYLKGLE